MKVLLIAPFNYLKVDRSAQVLNREDFYPSMALLYLAAILRAKNHEPVIVDLNNATVSNQKEKYFDYCKKIIIDNLNEHKPDLVGINCLFSGNFPDILKFAKTIKSHSPHLKIAVGGMHPTSFTKEILTNCNDIDYVVIGEGENAIVQLAASIEAKNGNLLSSIKSFAYKDKDGVVRINKETNYVDDLDSLPMPAWDLINFKDFEMKLDHYYNPQNLPIKFKAGIMSSRACPLACNFCDIHLVMGKKHRKKSPKKIVDEIELLNKDYDINYFSFHDDQLTMNRAHIMEVCDEILKRKLKIVFDTPNGIWINSIREEILAKLAEAGLVFASLPIEHGDDYIRNKVIGKVLERKKIFEVAKLIKKHKILSIGMFIMGFPEDTNETLQNSYDMADELEFDSVQFTTLMPLPGTALFRQVVKDKLFVRDVNLDELWKTPISDGQAGFIIKPYNMSLDDLYKWRAKFDKILRKHWKTSPKPPRLARGLKFDKDGRAPRLIYSN